MRENQPPRSAGVKAFLIAITLLFVVALGYVGLQLYTILHRTYRTETAIAYTMADSISLSGMAVFETVDVPGEDGQTVSTAVDYAYDMTMTVKATGKDVNVTFPDFSGYQEIDPSQMTGIAA